MAPWFKYLFRKNPNRFADEIWAAHNSNIGFEVRWAKRMMRICDKMKLNKIEQVQIFHIGLEYICKQRIYSSNRHISSLVRLPTNFNQTIS
jgi:hypothetical protein